jgi:hypothetical protein
VREDEGANEREGGRRVRVGVRGGGGDEGEGDREDAGEDGAKQRVQMRLVAQAVAKLTTHGTRRNRRPTD